MKIQVDPQAQVKMKRTPTGQHSLRRMMCVVAVLFATIGILQAEVTPNFIFINIDDLGYADVGPYGSKLNRTPHLDRMAREGRKLTCFYAAPVCSPSRAALMTGCYPKRALSIPGVLFPGNDVGLAPEEVTVAELLKQQGYATACIGKWHLGDQPEFLPRRQGFDYYFGLPYSDDMGPAKDGVKSNLGAPIPQRKRKGKGQPPLPMLRNETVLQRVLAHDQTTLVARYTEEALTFIRKNKDQRFFLYLPHSAVHFPIYPGEAFQGKSNNGIYGDWVEEVDWSVGQVLDAVRELGLSENTLVIFASDNGGTRRGVNAPLRGYKGSTFEGGMRGPTIAWWPGKIPADTVQNGIMSGMDWLPTLVAAAGNPNIIEELKKGKKMGGKKYKVHLDGYDQTAMLTKGGESNREEIWYFTSNTLGAVRIGHWKYVLQVQPDGWFGPKMKENMPRVYNLGQDPYEKAYSESLDFMLSLVGPNMWRTVFLQQQVAKLGESLIAYPPMQEGASFGIDRVKEKIKAAIHNHKGN